MGFNPEDVIKIAKAEVNYIEKESNSDLDSKTANAGDKNYTKYARDLDRISGFYNGKKNGFPWCDVFVDWCFVQAYGSGNAKKLLCQPNKSGGAGCNSSMKYYKAKNQFYTSPKAGDQIFFFNSELTEASHTGLVYKVSRTYVYTIEGNTSSEGGVVANGGRVQMKKYRLNNQRIAGYGRPEYGEITPVKKTESSDDSGYQCVYTVMGGDNLWKISKKLLGKGSRYKEIMALNGKKTTIIRKGEKLKIPNA